MTRSAGTGHRCVPHTADVRIEAWAPSREACLAEAVTALVRSFVECPDRAPTRAVELSLRADRDEDLLVVLLDEVIFRMETEGWLPLRTEVRPDRDTGIRLRVDAADTGEVRLIGAVPKAVSLHDLRFAADRDGWRCAVTLDV
jgi:SHS2 domain-containing protein